MKKSGGGYLKPSLHDPERHGSKLKLVSVLMPTYNRHYFLERQLKQTARQVLPPGYALQLVIVDDSPKRWEPPAGNPWIKYVFVTERTSVGKKRSIGIASSDGDFIIHQDDDDVMSTTRVATQARSPPLSPNLTVCACARVCVVVELSDQTAVETARAYFWRCPGCCSCAR